jgi:cell division transport system permease protein
VALENFQALNGRWDGGDPQISVFLKPEITQAEAETLQADISKWPETEKVTLITKEQGLLEFQKLSGTADVLSQLEQNPLPYVLEILPDAEHGQPAAAEALLQRLQALPQADMVQLDLEWVKRLEALLQLGKHIAFILVLMLSVGVLLVIGNTIRLEIENRRQEILVVKLVGGTDAFIRRSFLYTGFWYGFGGGLVASMIVAAALALLGKPVATLAGLYQSDYALMAMSLKDTLSLWMLSGWLGFFGAWFAVAKHLDKLEPR